MAPFASPDGTDDNPAAMMIRVEGLSYTYPAGRAAAVDAIDFEVPRGEIFGFLGPSGAGKSTAQKILIGLLRGYAGSARVLGREVAGWGPELYERIGVSFEVPNHFAKLTAVENLQLFAALYRAPAAPAREVLSWLSLEADGDTRVGAFSKGMKNRLSVARALQHRPELLLLDEPTAGLDPVNARRVRDLVRRERERGATVLLTTHDMVTADELCDRVAFLVDGRIRVLDAPRALKLHHGRRRLRVEYGEGDTTTVELDLDGLGDDAEFLRILRHERIQTLHTLEATLEQVFVETTGRTLS